MPGAVGAISPVKGAWRGTNNANEAVLTVILHDGRFYVVNVERNLLVRSHVDLEGYGRKLGVLQDWEEVAE